jgi:predicted site-specific integrase-resolvase
MNELPNTPRKSRPPVSLQVNKLSDFVRFYRMLFLMKLSEYAAKVGIKYQTAWKHDRQDLIPGAYQLATGTIIVPDDVLQKPGKTGVDAGVYARVSSSENRYNLETQVERMTQFATARGYKVVRVVKEVGSGINDWPQAVPVSAVR